MNKAAPVQTDFPDARVLIVDDERALRRTLGNFLAEVGYQPTKAPSGVKALEYLAQEDFDVMLLDLQMPGMNGTEVLRLAESVAPGTITIIMTAYGTLESAIAGIRHGAFEYLLKPCSVREIVRTIELGLMQREKRNRQKQDPIARLEAALADLKNEAKHSSSKRSPARLLQVDGLVVDKQKRVVLVEDEPADLTPTEYDLLVYLLENQDRVVSAGELVEVLRGYELEESEAQRFLHSHIYRLRQKLEPDPSDPRYVRTVRGQGYCLPTDPRPTD